MKYEEAAGPGKYRSLSTAPQFERKWRARPHLPSTSPSVKTQLLQPVKEPRQEMLLEVTKNRNT